jgi:hypothetical protein
MRYQWENFAEDFKKLQRFCAQQLEVDISLEPVSNDDLKGEIGEAFNDSWSSPSSRKVRRYAGGMSHYELKKFKARIPEYGVGELIHEVVHAILEPHELLDERWDSFSAVEDPVMLAVETCIARNSNVSRAGMRSVWEYQGRTQGTVWGTNWVHAREFDNFSDSHRRHLLREGFKHAQYLGIIDASGVVTGEPLPLGYVQNPVWPWKPVIPVPERIDG